MTPPVTFPPVFLERLHRHDTAARDPSGSRVWTRALAQQVFRTRAGIIGELALLLVGRDESVADALPGLPARLEQAGVDGNIVAAARDVLQAFDADVTDPPEPPPRGVELSHEEYEALTARNGRTPNAVQRFHEAVLRELHRRYVHLAPGDWVTWRSDLDDRPHLGKVLAVGDACAATLYITTRGECGSSGVHVELWSGTFERVERPAVPPLVAPGLSDLREAWETRDTLGRFRRDHVRDLLVPARNVLFSATTCLALEQPGASLYDFQGDPNDLPDHLPAGQSVVRDQLIALEHLLAGLSRRDRAGEGRLAPDEVADLEARLDAALEGVGAVVGSNVERDLPARVFLNAETVVEGTVVGRHGDRWRVGRDDGTTVDVDLLDLWHEGEMPTGDEDDDGDGIDLGTWGRVDRV